ncbi:MAG TPA: hypothetical protein VN915_06815 [Elusimicrobiota bacterium]|nr:hypothetical protein [Elusimicrobiota bacterium]
MNPDDIYRWGKALAVVAGVGSSAFVIASGVVQKINAVPGIQKDIAALQLQEAEKAGELRFVVRAVERMSGLKYHPAPASSR